MMNNQKILKPCPFCGGEACLERFIENRRPLFYFVYCKLCKTETAALPALEAIDFWNSRQPQGINLRPIEELTEEEISGGENILFHNSNNQYVIAKVFNYKSTFKLITSGNWSCKFNELPEAFTHFAKLTPPKANKHETTN